MYLGVFLAAFLTKRSAVHAWQPLSVGVRDKLHAGPGQEYTVNIMSGFAASLPHLIVHRELAVTLCSPSFEQCLLEFKHLHGDHNNQPPLETCALFVAVTINQPTES